MSGLDHDLRTGFFMHLFLDAEMPGSPLQGHQASYGIAQLNNFLQKIKKGEIKEEYVLALLSKSSHTTEASEKKEGILSSAEVDAFIEEIDFVKQCAERIENARSLDDLNLCATKIFEQLLKLGQIDFPGGYVDSEGGHAMMYRLVIDRQNQRLLFLVLNSGAGLDHHSSTVNPELTKVLYENVIAYQIPFAKLPFTSITQLPADAAQQDSFRVEAIAFITELLARQSPRLHKEPHYSARHLYTSVFEKIRFLGGEGCDTASLESKYAKPRFITAQRSGTCVQKSINQLVKHRIASKKASVAFMLAYRLDYLSQYIEYLKSKGLDQDPEHRQYVVMAVRNLSRILIKDLNKLALTPAHTAAIQKYLNSILIAFAPPIEEKKRVLELTVPVPQPRIQFSHLASIGERDLHQHPVNKRVLDPVGDDLSANLAAIFADPSVDAMESIKRLCLQSLPKRLAELREAKESKEIKVTPVAEVKIASDKTKPPVSVSQSLVQGMKWFLLGETVTSCDRTVSALPLVQNLLKALKCFNGQLSPQSVTVYFSLMVLALTEFDKPEFRLSGPAGACLLDIHSGLILRCLKIIQEKPYLASYIPEFDLLLESIEDSLQRRPYRNILSYYLQVIDEHPVIAQQLLEKYRTTSKLVFKIKLAKLGDFYFDNFEPGHWHYEHCPGIEKLLAYLVLLTEEERLRPEYYPVTKALDQVRQYQEYLCECLRQITTKAPSIGLDPYAERRQLTPAPYLYRMGIHSLTDELILLDYRDLRKELIPKDMPLDADLKLRSSELEGVGVPTDDPIARHRFYHRVFSHDTIFAHNLYSERMGDLHKNYKVTSQLENVVGYYQQHPRLLREENHRLYLSLCLFEPGLLINKFLSPVGREQEAEAFLQAFTGFFRSSLAFYDRIQGGKISEVQLFLLQLATQLYGYAAQPEFRLVRALAYEQLCHLEKMLQDYLHKYASQDKVAGLKLRKIKLLLLMRKLGASSEMDSADARVEELMRLKIEIAKCRSEMSADFKESAAEKEFADHLDAQIHDYLIRHDATVLKHLPIIIQQTYPELKLSFSKAETIEGQLLLYRLVSDKGEEYRVDLGSGCLIVKDRYRKPLPAAIYSNPQYIQVIGEEVAAWFDPRDSFYYFTHQGREYRAFASNPPELQTFIQGAWYTLSARHLSAAPRLYQQNHYRWWFKGKEAYIYDCERGYFVYHCQADGTVNALDAGEAYKIIAKVEFKPHRELLKPFLAVESAEFIEVLKTDSAKRLVNLPRYGLQFELLTGDLSQAFCRIDNKKFKLVPKPQLDFFGFSGYLLLEEQEQPKPKRVVRVPWQAFIVKKTGIAKSRQKEGLHYKLIQDHQHLIKESLFADEKSPHTHHWRYNGTERMVDFTLAENGELQAHSAADQLYLVYIYLANNRPDLAAKVLGDIQLLGSAEELENAFLILRQLPAQEEEQLNTPANLAVQNKLLCMLAELGINRKKPIVIPEPKAVDPSDDNHTYAQKHYQSLLRFYQTLDTVIAEKHLLYLNTLNNIPANYRLDAESEHLLLSYYVMGHSCLFNPSSKLSAPMSEARDTLCVEYLEKRHPLLLARWSALQHHTMEHVQGLSLDQEGKAVIAPELKGLRPILAQATVMKTKKLKISVGLSEKPTVSDDIITIEITQDQVMESLFSRQIVDSSALPKLSLTLTHVNLIKYLPNYYQRLLDEKETAFRESTQAFCERALAYCALLPDTDEERHKLAYFNFLLTVARNPSAFKSLKHYKKLNKKDDPDGRKAIASAWEAIASTAPPILVSGIREFKPQAIEMSEHKVTLPALSRDKSLVSETKECKLRPPPIAINTPHLEKIRSYKKECEGKVNAIKARPLPECKEVREAFRQERKMEDEVAEVISTYNGLIDKEITAFFASDQGFIKLSSTAKVALKKKTREIAELKKALHDNFFKAESLDELLKEMGGVSAEIIPHTMLLLARLVAKDDPAILEKFPKLKAKKKEFLAAIEDYLAACFAAGWLKKICEQTHSDLASQRALVKYILDYNVSTRFETHILQYVDNIAIYPEQQEQLDAVLSLPKDRPKAAATTVPLPPGAGKTVLLIPGLAAVMADGEHLVVVQVPAPLLPSIVADLSKTSRRVYQQRVVTVAFDRDSDCSPLALYDLYCLLINLTAYRGYLVISKASRDALDAKLQELLAYAAATMQAGGALDLYAQQQIHYLAEINKILEGAHNITDEAHEASRIRDEMRYTFGKRISIPKAQINDLQLFFDRFFKVKYDGEHSFFDLIQRNSNLPAPSPEELNRVIQSFFTSELLAACFPGKSAAANEKLKAFFFNTHDSDPERIKSFLTTQEYSRALLYRELCQNFLTYALNRRLFVHYGPAEEDDPRAKLGLAVYFKYNNTPSPNQFSHYLETAVLTIFMVYSLGIDRYTFNRLIQRFYEKHLSERRQLALAGKIGVSTETEKLFKSLFGFALETIHSPKAMDKIFNAIRLKPEVITVALQDEILPNVEVYDEELFKDSITHAYRYRQRILLSGTLRTYKTFDHKVDHQPARTLAANGYIRKKINDNTRVVVLPRRSTKDYISALMDIDDPVQLTAIIDVGAHLDGIPNEQVARHIAEKLLLQKRGDQTKFVLFCDTQGQWCALSTEDVAKPLIRLNGTTQEELNTKLGPLGCYFTFYDQARCEGTDIRQPSTSRAVITLAKDTTESAYQQAGMRMRGLGNGQTLTAVVPDELAGKMYRSKSGVVAAEGKEFDAKKAVLKPADVADYTFETELNSLIPDHRHAARFRMFNVLREDLAKRIKQVSDKNQWPIYFGHFREFFIRSQSLSAIELFASKWKKMRLQDLLQEEADRLLQDWQRVIKAAAIELTDKEVQAMRAQIDQFIAQALLDCEPEVLHTHQRSLGTATQVQLQTKTTTQVQVRCQVQLESQPHDSKPRHPAEIASWVFGFLAKREQDISTFTLSPEWIDIIAQEYHRSEPDGTWSKENKDKYDEKCHFLKTTTWITAYQDRLDATFAENGLNLSKHIYGSHYYYRESDLYGPTMEPIQGLLFVGTEPLSVIILTVKEIQEAKARWPYYYKTDPSGKQPCLWLEDISGIPLGGTRPVGIAERADYQLLKEQLWFLNGNMELLMGMEEFQWLSESSQTKINFYKRHISRAHRGMEEANIEPLETRLLEAISPAQRLSLYRNVQEQIIKLGLTKAACERPEELNEKQFGRYLAAMHCIWEAFARNETAHLATKNWGLEYRLPLETVALLKEYMLHLQKMQTLLSSSTAILSTMLDHMDQWLYPYPLTSEADQEAKDIPSLRFVELCIDKLMAADKADASVPPIYDREALECLKAELRHREALEPLTDEDKSRYCLRLLDCVQDKRARTSLLLQHPKWAHLVDKFETEASDPIPTEMPLTLCDQPLVPASAAPPVIAQTVSLAPAAVDSQRFWNYLGTLSLLIGCALFILIMIGIISFAFLSILFTILTIAAPICFGLYVLARAHTIPHQHSVKTGLADVQASPVPSLSLTPDKATSSPLVPPGQGSSSSTTQSLDQSHR